MKRCGRCGEPKPLDEFYNASNLKGGKAGHCKECDNKKRKAHHDNNLGQERERAARYWNDNKERLSPRRSQYGAKWYLENKDKKDAQNKEWREEHPEECRRYARDWRERHPDLSLAASERYYASNKKKIAQRRREGIQKIRDYKKKRNQTDPNFRLYNRLSSRMRNAITKSNGIKSNTTIDLLGCSPAFLRSYLEIQFKRGMTWDNYGYYWEIDHIIPCDEWDLADPQEQFKCFHFSNLQPLTRKANRHKSATITDGQTKLLL